MMETTTKPTSRWQRLALAVLLAAIAAAALHFWQPWQKVLQHAPPPQEPEGTWVLVAPQLLEQRLGLAGRIQAARQQTLIAPFDGTVREMLVQEGERVVSGQPLLRLDSEQLDIQLRQARAELLKAQKSAKRLRNWSRSPEVSRARRAVQQAQSKLANTEANLRDTRALFQRGVVARMEVDNLEQQARTQQQDLQAAQEELQNVEARGSSEDRKIAEMELSNVQAKYHALEARAAQQTIQAPFDGIVVRPAGGAKTAGVQVGAQVSKGASLLTVIGQDQIQVVTRVAESDLGVLKAGMPVQITGDGFAGQTLSGQISTISVQGTAADSPGATAYYDVQVSVDPDQNEATRQMRLGMSARLAVTLYRNEQGMAIPPDALHLAPDGSYTVQFRESPASPVATIKVRTGKTVIQGIEVHDLPPGYVLLGEAAPPQVDHM